MSLLQSNTDVVTGTILGPDGSVLNKPTAILTQQEAEILRQYKKFLAVRGLRVATYCNVCFSGDLEHDGMRAFVRDDQILFECRHRMLFYQGQTF